tara:strand:- start:3128 stop:4441 length:1314 start_codon:yes stop_codon:yes gene_type:complete
LKNRLNNIILKNNAKIGIIGLGYVGLPLAIRFSEKNFLVTGFDVDSDKNDILNSRKSYIDHISSKKIDSMVDKGFIATDDYKEISKQNIIIICVPTPLGVHNEPDLSFIHSTMNEIQPFLVENQLLILESTTYPGTTEEEIVPYINSNEKISKLKVGENFFVGYSPEREDPGNENFSTKSIPKIVSGYSNTCLELTKNLYDQIIDKTVTVSSLRVAEMTKILENIHRAVNIGLVNELKILSNKMDIDIFEVINAAATKPFGFTPFYPGPGLGGHCIPIDPFYLTWKAKEVGMHTRFIELAGEINTSMPAYVIQKVADALNDKGKSLKGSKILVLGLSYKKNVDDCRESPSLELINILSEKGAKVEYSDPYFSTSPKTRKFKHFLTSIKLNQKNINSFDAVLLSTDHDGFDYDLIFSSAKIIIDTRGKFKSSSNVIKA